MIVNPWQPVAAIVLALWLVGLALGLLMLTNEHRAAVEELAAVRSELSDVRSELAETGRRLEVARQWLTYATAANTSERVGALLEAERRGLLEAEADDTDTLKLKALLWEARRAGLAPEPLAGSDSTGR